jgi:hypothetical protein
MFDRRDWEAVIDPSRATPRTAELDNFVRRLLERNLIVEEHKQDAILQFRLAVMNAALFARLAYLEEQDSAQGIAAAKRTQAEVETILSRLRALDPIDRETPQNLKTQAEQALMALRDEFEPRACLDIKNRRNTDVFKNTLIEKLIFDWERLTIAAQHKAEFVSLVKVAFAFLDVESPDVGRYVRDVLKRKKDLKAQ